MKNEVKYYFLGRAILGLDEQESHYGSQYLQAKHHNNNKLVQTHIIKFFHTNTF